MYHTNISAKNRIVEMYHAGTPASAKEHILTSMATDDADLRILICTVAFDMGGNCKGVRRAIHFGPSKSVELYVQECGRAGRDGLPSTCVLLYNGLLSSHCDSDMKQYVRIEQCRRKWLMDHFGFTGNSSNLTMNSHDCCDICANHCKCASENCGEFWGLMKGKVSLSNLSEGTYNDSKNMATRVRFNITERDRSSLRKKLLDLQQELREQVEVDKMVSCPNILLEFNIFHVNQVIENCSRLLQWMMYLRVWKYGVITMPNAS